MQGPDASIRARTDGVGCGGVSGFRGTVMMVSPPSFLCHIGCCSYGWVASTTFGPVTVDPSHASSHCPPPPPPPPPECRANRGGSERPAAPIRVPPTGNQQLRRRRQWWRRRQQQQRKQRQRQQAAAAGTAAAAAAAAAATAAAAAAAAAAARCSRRPGESRRRGWRCWCPSSRSGRPACPRGRRTASSCSTCARSKNQIRGGALPVLFNGEPAPDSISWTTLTPPPRARARSGRTAPRMASLRAQTHT